MAEQIIIKSGIKVYEIVNEEGRHLADLTIDTKDAHLKEKFINLSRRVLELSKENAAKREEITQNAKTSERELRNGNITEDHIDTVDRLLAADMEAARELAKEFNVLFGDGFVEDYFTEHYEIDVEFEPDANALVDLLNDIAPTIEVVLGQSNAPKYAPNKKGRR